MKSNSTFSRTTLSLVLRTCLVAGMLPALSNACPTVNQASRSLFDLSLEELMEVKVTSVMGQEQTLQQTAAGVFVITREDIRRSAAQSLPELLRIVPGLHVARMDSSHWAISARGGNSFFSDKLLVMIDGRTVYTPIFSNVYWNAQDVFLDDVERIEVVRGPGSAMWGVNAVNGVINIITRDSRDTVGASVHAGVGKEEGVFGGARTGTDVGADGAVRVYARHRKQAASERLDGNSNYDKFELTQGGFRSDFQNGRSQLTLQGDIYEGHDQFEALMVPHNSGQAELYREPSRYSGGNLLLRGEMPLGSDSIVELQSYYDQVYRNDVAHIERVHTWDFDSRIRWQPSDNHTFMTGAGARLIDTEVTSDFFTNHHPGRSYTIGHGFIQDQWDPRSDISVITGMRVEHHPFTGAEWMPGIRAAWSVTPENVLWAAVSRAVRTPDHSENDFVFQIPASGDQAGGSPWPTTVQMLPSRTISSQRLTAHEVGFRSEISSRLTMDLTLFYNHYTRVFGYDPHEPELVHGTSGTYAVAPVSYNNGIDFNSYGGEIAANWQIGNHWRMQMWYSSLHHDSAGSRTGEDPDNQFSARSLWSITEHIELDTTLRYVDKLPQFEIPSYTEVDLRLGWHPEPWIEFSIAGLNLLHSAHREYQEDVLQVTPAKIQRSIYGMVTVRF